MTYSVAWWWYVILICFGVSLHLNWLEIIHSLKRRVLIIVVFWNVQAFREISSIGSVLVNIILSFLILIVFEVSDFMLVCAMSKNFTILSKDMVILVICLFKSLLRVCLVKLIPTNFEGSRPSCCRWILCHLSIIIDTKKAEFNQLVWIDCYSKKIFLSWWILC